MLSELFVENFALIEKLRVGFDAGLNVITGETGAGKSLIIDAVGLLLGGRANQDYVRIGTDRAVVQGTFSAPFSEAVSDFLLETGITSEEDVLILNREIQRNGKHTCRINFRPVPLSLYRELGKRLINIHGQHDNVTLLEEQNQLLLLDSFGGEGIGEKKEKVRNSFAALKNLTGRLKEIKQNSMDAERMIDLLNYQIKEIEEAGLRQNEEDELYSERNRLQNAEKLALESRMIYEKLYGSRHRGAADMISEAGTMLKQLSGIDKELEPVSERLNGLYFEIEDVIREISGYMENIIIDPERLEKVDKRLTEISKLRKKYGNTVDEIYLFLEKSNIQMDELKHREENIKELDESREKEREFFRALSISLTELRKNAAEKLSNAVTCELRQLQMPDAVFKVAIEPAEDSALGCDSVGFLISPNPGEGLKPVTKIASGGEMSRIMLGIKVILAGLDGIPTLIFDEIDSGLGGRIVYAVGDKLALIGEETQVICVTHSPVVASFADSHLYISKEAVSGRTVTGIIKLHEEQVLQEICRMLAGDNATEITKAQARELLNMGHRKKDLIKKCQ